MNNLADEVFCLRYELEALAGQINGGELERWIEGFSPLPVHHEHLQRYQFAASFTKGRKVLDIACGTGRGTRILAEEGAAAKVMGYDIGEDAVRYATLRNGRENISFAVSDGTMLEAGSDFDVAVSFETIEHVSDPEAFLARIAAALKVDGLLIISTPISLREVDHEPGNRYHQREWGAEAFRQLVGARFRVRKIHYQYRPFRKRPFLYRVLARIKGNPGPPIRSEARPEWHDFDADGPAPFLPEFTAAYQVLECTKK